MGSSTGTLLFWPDRSCLDGAEGVLEALEPHRIRFLDDDWHNPMEWLDRTGQGVFVRLVPLTPFSDDDALGWGGIDWDAPDKARGRAARRGVARPAHSEPMVRAL